ncbi:MAG: hypothetical protein WC481_07555 [Candidatus Omnitrophota bacterium]
MPLEEAIELVKQSEAREHRYHGEQRGKIIREAFDVVIEAAIINSEKWHPSLVLTGISKMY